MEDIGVHVVNDATTGEFLRWTSADTPAPRLTKMGTGTIDGVELAPRAAQGVVAAMAMTGLRQMNARLGLMKTTPPEMIVQQPVVEQRLSALSEDQRRAAAIALHWTLGALGAVGYQLLPKMLQRRLLVSVAYGNLMWLGFDALLSSSLKMKGDLDAKDRVALVLDHSLYGVVLAMERREPLSRR